MRALIIDGSRGIRAIIRRMLRELGFEVLEAASGREGLEVVRNRGPLAVALVDWNLPEMNGVELVRAIRREVGARDLPVMMVTTETATAQVVEALAAGANEYLMKPFTKDVLVAKLQLIGVEP